MKSASDRKTGIRWFLFITAAVIKIFRKSATQKKYKKAEHSIHIRYVNLSNIYIAKIKGTEY